MRALEKRPTKPTYKFKAKAHYSLIAYCPITLSVAQLWVTNI